MRRDLRIYLFSMGAAFTLYSAAVATKYRLSHENTEAPSAYKSSLVFGTGITGLGLIGSAVLNKRNRVSRLEE